MLVSDVMTSNPRTCTPRHTLEEVAQWMSENACGSLPVVDEQDPRTVIGMITDRDICTAALDAGKSLKELRVDDGMSRDPAICAPEDDTWDAVSKMNRFQVGRLPVVGQEGLVGVLTLAQIARTQGEQEGRDQQEVAETLSAISQPNDGSRGDLHTG